MDPLLFVTRHQGWLWIALVVLAVGLNVAWIRFGPRLTARLRAARLRGHLGEATPLETATEGDEITLTGTLGLAGEPTPRFEGRGTAAATTAAPVRPSDVVGALAINRRGEGLGLDAGGVDVGIAGDLEVLVGSTEVYPGQRFRRLGGATEEQLSSLDGDALLAMSSYRAAYRSLQAGDAVRVRGFLCRGDSLAGADSYRAGGGRWVLAPQPISDEDKAKGWPMAAAFEGTPTIALPGWARLARKVVAVAVAWTVGFFAAGGAVTEFHGPFRGPYVRAGPDLSGYCYLDPVTPLTYVSLVLPFAEWDEQRDLSRALGRRCRWREVDVDQLAAVQGIRGRCQEAAQAFVEHGALRRGGEELDRCTAGSSSDIAWRLRFLLGRFDEASELAREGPERYYQFHDGLRAQAHLLAGAPEWVPLPLGRHARRRGDYAGRRVLDRLAHPSQLMGLSRACLADSMATMDRDPEASSRLAVHAELGLRYSACPLLHAERLDAPERAALIRRVARESETHRWEALLLIATRDPAAADGVSQGYVGGALGTLSVGPMGQVPPGDLFGALEAGALQALETLEAPGQRATVLRAELHARATQVELALGEIEEARRHARRVVEDLRRIDAPDQPNQTRYEWYQLAIARQAVVELWDGEVGAADELIRQIPPTPPSDTDTRDTLIHLHALRSFVADGEVSAMLESRMVHSRGRGAAWRAVERGDAEGIAASMAGFDRPLSWRTLPLWLRHLPADPSAVREQARWRDRQFGDDPTLWQILLIHAWDLQVARALGDEEWVAEVEPVYQAHREAHLDHHDLGLALRLIEAP